MSTTPECRVCVHPQRLLIEQALAAGGDPLAVSQHYHCAPWPWVERHRDEGHAVAPRGTVADVRPDKLQRLLQPAPVQRPTHAAPHVRPAAGLDLLSAPDPDRAELDRLLAMTPAGRDALAARRRAHPEDVDPEVRRLLSLTTLGRDVLAERERRRR